MRNIIYTFIIIYLLIIFIETIYLLDRNNKFKALLKKIKKINLKNLYEKNEYIIDFFYKVVVGIITVFFIYNNYELAKDNKEFMKKQTASKMNLIKKSDKVILTNYGGNVYDLAMSDIDSIDVEFSNKYILHILVENYGLVNDKKENIWEYDYKENTDESMLLYNKIKNEYKNDSKIKSIKLGQKYYRIYYNNYQNEKKKSIII